MTLCEILINLALLMLGVIIALWYENLGAPRILISPHVTTQSTKQNQLTVRFLHLMISNNPRKLPLVSRRTAQDCHGSINFLDNNHKPLGVSVQIKWDGTPEPVKPEIVNGQVVYLFDNRLLRSCRYINIPPEEQESIAVAMRIQGDSQAYAWSCQNYQLPDWRHPDLQLPQGTMVARVTISSGDSVTRKDFVFDNPPSFTDFELQENN